MKNIPIIRPAKMSDLDSLVRFAQHTGSGITSLPNNPQVLEKKLLDSHQAFQEEHLVSHHENYLFCLDYGGAVVGISGIVSRIGMDEPFLAYHILQENVRCPHLNIDREVALLNFTKARTKPTEIGTLFLEPPFRKKEWGKLLSFSRFLFISQFKERFAPVIIAELRGVNVRGYSAFWEAVGRPFFQMEFAEADALRTKNPLAVEELFPKHPIYVNLLPKEAQRVIGKTHPETEPAKKILLQQGFKVSHYVDIFDAGPHLFAHQDEIEAIHSSKKAKVHITSVPIKSPPRLVANPRLDFRATLAPLFIEKKMAIIDHTTAAALELNEADLILYY